VGVYSTAGSLSAALGPLVQGLVANQWGVRAVFGTTALAVAAGLLAVSYLYTRIAPESAALTPAPVVVSERH